MRGKTNPIFNIFSGILLILALFLGACDSDDVTGPAESRTTPPVTPPNNSTWTITVTTNPGELDLAAGGTVQVLVSARRTGNNQLVPVGTTALLTTTDGTLTTNDGQTGDSVPIVFDEAGQSRANLTLGAFAFPTTVVVRSQIQSSFGSARVQLVEVQQVPFQITGISPATGHPLGGTLVTIFGTSFLPSADVTFSGNFGTFSATDVNVESSTRMTVVTPAINLASGANATATITVANGPDPTTGTSTDSDSLSGIYTYTRSSTGAITVKLISISPTQGPNEGGTQVTIRGEGFGPEAQVYFSNGPLVEATVLTITPTQIEAITPAAVGPNAGNQNRSVSVTVRDPSSGQEDSLNGAFQYGGPPGFISSIRPTEGEYLGGDEVLIFGQGFEEPVAVEAGQLAQQVLSVSGTEVLFRTVGANINCANQSGATRVVNIETNESVTGPSFTYRPVRPQLLGLTPGTGSAGDPVTITGVGRAYTVGFDPPIRVLFDDVPTPGTIGGVFGETVSTFAPPFTGDFDEEDCAGGGNGNIVTFVDVEVVNLNTGCSDTLNNGWGYVPTSGTCSQGGNGNGGAVNTDAEIRPEADAIIPRRYELFADVPNGQPAIASYVWGVGDGVFVGGSTMNSTSPTVQFPDPGLRTITLTCTSVVAGATCSAAPFMLNVP